MNQKSKLPANTLRNEREWYTSRGRLQLGKHFRDALFTAQQRKLFVLINWPPLKVQCGGQSIGNVRAN